MEAFPYLFRSNVDINTQATDHIRASASAGDRAVTVFGDQIPSARHHKGGCGRDIKGIGAVTAGTAGIHNRLPVNVDVVPV